MILTHYNEYKLQTVVSDFSVTHNVLRNRFVSAI